jgi:hypothetical protein
MPYESIEDILAYKISILSVYQIEEFLGKEISAEELENAESIIHEKLDGMEEDELLKVEEMFWNFDDPTGLLKGVQ